MGKEDKRINYDEAFNKINFLSNRTDLPLGKLLAFPTVTVVIRCVIKRGEHLYPQVYLEHC